MDILMAMLSREASEMVLLFPLHPGLEFLTIFTSACSAASAVQLFIQCAVGVSRSETAIQLRSEPATISRHPNHKLTPAVTWRCRQLRSVERRGGEIGTGGHEDDIPLGEFFP